MIKNNQILLTVAIPTYNRAKTLEEVIVQLNREKERSFLILISDDNSSDDTEIMVKKYQKLLPNLIYKKNKTNLGFSGNVCKLYELSKTKYIWFLCDDDTVLPGAVTKILQAINKYKPTVALFNCTWIDSYGRKLLAGVKHNIIYQDINKFTNYQVLTKTTYLSIIVVEKKIRIDKLKQKNYRDNIFFQTSLVLFLLSKQFKLCEIASTIVHRNVGYKYGEFFKFCLVDFSKAIHIINHKFDNEQFIKLGKGSIISNFQLYLSQKIGLFEFKNKITNKTKNFLFRYFGLVYGLFFISFPLLKLIIPTFLIRFIYLINLINIHGYQKGIIIYNKNINRAFKDKRKTGFINYQ